MAEKPHLAHKLTEQHHKDVGLGLQTLQGGLPVPMLLWSTHPLQEAL